MCLRFLTMDEKLYLKPEAKVNPKILRTLKSLKKTDKIVISPGNFHSTLIPNFLVSGLPEAVKESKAKVICVVNLMARVKQNDSFNLNDYVSNLEKYLGKGVIEYVIFNTEIPNKEYLEKYSQKGEKLMNTGNFVETKGVKFLGYNLLSEELQKINENDVLSNRRSLIKHDSKKLAKAIYEL